MHGGNRRPGLSAFTLIELVTVIAILGILAVAVAGPTLSYIDSIRARAAASRLASDIRYTQRLALSSGLRTWVVFNVGANNYRLYVEDSAHLGKTGRLPATRPYDQSSGPVQFGAGEYINVAITGVSLNGTSELEFDTFGTPYDGNGAALTTDATVNLSSGTSVMVHPLGGMVERAG